MALAAGGDESAEPGLDAGGRRRVGEWRGAACRGQASGDESRRLASARRTLASTQAKQNAFHVFALLGYESAPGVVLVALAPGGSTSTDSDVALELAWMNNMVHFSFPYLLQFIREYTSKVDDLVKDKIEPQAGIFPDYLVARLVRAGGGRWWRFPAAGSPVVGGGGAAEAYVRVSSVAVHRKPEMLRRVEKSLMCSISF
ncbi:hypothetical protein GUJ93_ZPchr1273g29126 [Zizania palustris]|uniref:Uncharacterized protein n=1 Tax=Zizania palustris TaxID=103762 RepID=A0A8J5R162_ZIZPA|nr:hypothetical protein GUJ93_ZPchr1273g29126 [Zizania palustris]